MKIRIIYLLSIFESDERNRPSQKKSDIVIFDGDSNVKLAGRLLELNYTNLAVISGVEHTVLLFFNDASKIPIVNEIISTHKMIYNIFGSGIYHKHHSIFKSKSQEFHNRSIGLFSGNETRMDVYFMEIHRYLRMRKVLQATTLSAEFFSIPNNTLSASKIICASSFHI